MDDTVPPPWRTRLPEVQHRLGRLFCFPVGTVFQIDKQAETENVSRILLFVMPANTGNSGKSLIEEAVTWLRQRFSDDWEFELSDAPEAGMRLNIRGQGGFGAAILVQAWDELSPREASNLLPGFGRALRSMHDPGLLVVAPWLSPRSREVLLEEEINYIDLTGNALLRLRTPAVYIETSGASRNPNPTERRPASLRGAKAASLLRLLIDVRPPYGVRELATFTGLAPGYVSRLLDTLFREALIERSPRGKVESVNYPALLRRWAEFYDVFDTNEAELFVAREGLDRVLPRLRELEGQNGVDLATVTGSFAAARRAPVTAPAMLLLYCGTYLETLAEDLALIPVESGADVALLQPFSPMVLAAESRDSDGITYVSPAQAALDCLTGNGRMPAEGEALIDWMTANESAWRAESLGLGE